MARRKSRGPPSHPFRDKLLLNQWLISLFGIYPWADASQQGDPPFRVLTKPISDSRLEGLDHNNLHHFYRELVESDLFASDQCALSREQALLWKRLYQNDHS